MLIRLFGSNFHSLRDDFELSLVAADLTRGEDKHRGVFSVEVAGIDEPLRLLRTIAIYGANASGKSSVLTAARALNWIVENSSIKSKPDAVIPPYEPFLLDDSTRSAPVKLGCDLVHEGTVLRYELHYTSKAIVLETLTRFGKSGPTVLLNRNADGHVEGGLISKSGQNRLYVQDIQPQVAVLSKLAQHGPQKGKESVQKFYKAILNATACRDYLSSANSFWFNMEPDHLERFADDQPFQDWIMSNLIRPADLGIVNVEVRRKKPAISDAARERRKARGLPEVPDDEVLVSFRHGKEGIVVPFHWESSGTHKLFHLGADWWQLFNSSRTLFADELSASLHPKLLDGLVRAINEGNHEQQSQVIFASHDTGLLESRDGLPPALRRDQVYFTEKNEDGATRLFSLAEFKEDARPVHNIRKRYMSGLYGAFPRTETFHP